MQTTTAGGNESDTVYLGTLDNANDCFAIAEKSGGKYHSATWHTPGFSGSTNPFDGQCFGVTGTCVSIFLAFVKQIHITCVIIDINILETFIFTTVNRIIFYVPKHAIFKNDPLPVVTYMTPLLRNGMASASSGQGHIGTVSLEMFICRRL